VILGKLPSRLAERLSELVNGDEIMSKTEKETALAEATMALTPSEREAYQKYLETSKPGTKKCSKCKKEKKIEEFSKHKRKTDGRQRQCKECCRDNFIKWVEIPGNRKKTQENSNSRREDPKNKAEIALYQRDWLSIPGNKDKKNRQIKDWQEIPENRERKLKRQNVYTQQLRETDSAFRTKCNLRSRIYKALKNQSSKKYFSSNDLLGCTPEECNKYLESKFQTTRPNSKNPDDDTVMTWENQGYYGWHIDHIKPCSSFDLSDPEQQKLCFHYTNLQPLWAEDNFAKNDNMAGE
jgi:hypothetical protein